MQPTLVITAPVPGMVYVNGRFSGEASSELPLFAPVPPFGAVYLEYHPLEPGYLPIARKIVLSSGSPLPDILAEDVFAIRWPGRITEIELSVPELSTPAVESFVLDGISFRIIRGDRGSIDIGPLSCAFPADARSPQLHRLPGCIAIAVESGQERCLLTLSADLSRQTGFIKADRIDVGPGGAITAITAKGDFAGHAVLEKWQADTAGLRLISSEPTWLDGVPRVPSTPEETAIAAIQAALHVSPDEAAQYLSPALLALHPLDSVGDLGSACLPMKYSMPDGRLCVGLMQVETGSCASVIPVYYRAQRAGDRFLLTELAFEP